MRSVFDGERTSERRQGKFERKVMGRELVGGLVTTWARFGSKNCLPSPPFPRSPSSPNVINVNAARPVPDTARGQCGGG